MGGLDLLWVVVVPMVLSQGSDNYRHREAASDALRSVGESAEPYVVRFGLKSPDPEVRRRSRLVLSHYVEGYCKRVDAFISEGDMPYLALLPPDFPERNKILENSGWGNNPELTRGFFRNMIMDRKLTEQQAVELVRVLRDAKKNNNNGDPSKWGSGPP